MRQRDRAFLLNVAQFIYMNRVATAYTLAQSITNPGPIANLTVRGIHGQPHPLLGSAHQEALVNELSQARIASIQSIMVARIFAELIAAYEDLGAFCWAVRIRNSHREKGIFVNYIKTRNGDSTQFFQHVIREVSNSTPEKLSIGLDDLLNLPPQGEIEGKVPQELHSMVERDFQEKPKYFYDTARFYTADLGEVWQLATATEQVATQSTPTQGAESYINVILDALPAGTSPNHSKITTEVYNKIKHIFMLTENLSAYADPTDSIHIVHASLKRDHAVVQDWLNGIKSAAGTVNDIASLLILLEGFGVAL